MTTEQDVLVQRLYMRSTLESGFQQSGADVDLIPPMTSHCRKTIGNFNMNGKHC
jgi:hypothetical protein